MITEQHYTRLNEHPEDRIFKDREYIKRLQRHIDEIYEELCSDLRMSEEGKNHLLDYIFNEDTEEEFEDYLIKYKQSYEKLAYRKLQKEKTKSS